MSPWVSLWRWLRHRLSQCQTLSTAILFWTILFRTIALHLPMKGIWYLMVLICTNKWKTHFNLVNKIFVMTKRLLYMGKVNGKGPCVANERALFEWTAPNIGVCFSPRLVREMCCTVSYWWCQLLHCTFGSSVVHAHVVRVGTVFVACNPHAQNIHFPREYLDRISACYMYTVGRSFK